MIHILENIRRQISEAVDNIDFLFTFFVKIEKASKAVIQSNGCSNKPIAFPIQNIGEKLIDSCLVFNYFFSRLIFVVATGYC